MSIDKLPGAFWVILFGAIYAGLQAFVTAQWPDAPPAAVLGLMTTLGVLMGLVKVLWPQPVAPALPPGVSAQAGMAGPAAPQQESKVKRFLF